MMRKVVLYLIIIFGLGLTSGTSLMMLAQARLDNTLSIIGATHPSAQIRAWIPVRGGSSEDFNSVNTTDWQGSVQPAAAEGKYFTIGQWRTSSLQNVIKTYIAMRKKASSQGGGATLAIEATLSGKPDLRNVGQLILHRLGATNIVQEVQSQYFYSSAAEVPGFGETIIAGEDKINVQIITRYDDSGKVKIYIVAPVLMGDL